MQKKVRTKKKNVIVTGGAGFVGKHLIKALLDKKYKVTIVTRSTKRPYGNTVGYVRADLRNSLTVQKFLNKFDIIIHLAGNVKINDSFANPEPMIRENTDMTITILEAMRQAKKKQLLIFASTNRVYGQTRKRVVAESTPLVGIDPYGTSKIICERLCELYHHLYGVSYIAFRFDSIYGPYQPKSMFISDVIQKMQKDDIVSVGDLSVKKNFVYVGDVVNVMMKAITAPAKTHNTVYNIGGKQYALKDLFRIIKNDIEKRTGRSISVRYSSKFVRKKGTEVSSFMLSCSKAKRAFGWSPRKTLSQGLTQTINYFFGNK